MTLFGKEEKKVEYLELIYDLIFVYMVGRNNSIMHHIDNGFVSAWSFAAYVLCTLAIIQIWTFSTFYINLYGRNGVRDHIFLFINMYLLYHMSTAISADWEASFYRFSAAWAMILINLGIQHIIEARNHRAAPWELKQLRQKAAIIFAEALLVAAQMPLYALTGISFAYVPLIFGIIATLFSGRLNVLVPVDFGHLSERAMLYVVFTFGEMIIVLADYFSGELTWSSMYFSLMGFLIVIGLLLSYGTIYNRIVDRDKTTNGTAYMMFHVFLIFALNNISVALEFMRDSEVDVLSKNLFLSGSFALYFIFLFLIGIFAKKRCGFSRSFVLILSGILLSFFALMFLFRKLMYVNIAVSVAYVFLIFIILYRRGKRMEA